MFSIHSSPFQLFPKTLRKVGGRPVSGQSHRPFYHLIPGKKARRTYSNSVAVKLNIILSKSINLASFKKLKKWSQKNEAFLKQFPIG